MQSFTLQNDPAPQRTRQTQCFAPQPERQQVLFAGLDCLAGQMDLFATDGEREEADNESAVR